MLNYEVDPKILAPFLPTGTELDFWNGKTFVSVVGFRFQKTRVRGIPIPFHRNFEEINLRFYVRRKADDGWRRAVVFIKEIVPRFAIAFVARTIYNEPYITLPTATKLKVTGIKLFSVGDFQGDEHSQSLCFTDSAMGIYKKLVIKADRLIGAVLYGDTADGGWYQELLENEENISRLRDTLIFGKAYG